jgi:hypothetical protein
MPGPFSVRNTVVNCEGERVVGRERRGQGNGWVATERGSPPRTKLKGHASEIIKGRTTPTTNLANHVPPNAFSTEPYAIFVIRPLRDVTSSETCSHLILSSACDGEYDSQRYTRERCAEAVRCWELRRQQFRLPTGRGQPQLQEDSDWRAL